MKKTFILGTLLVIFVLSSCKNKDTQPQEIVVPEKTNPKVLKETDTSIQISPFKKDVEKNEAEVLSPNKNVTEVNKTTSAPVKVETTTKTVTKPIIEKENEVITKAPVVTKTETKTEVIMDAPVETKTEPKVTEAPTNTDSNAWKVPSKYVTMKNPIPTKQDAAIGKSLYDKHCKSCHGKEGYGDGPKAADLKGDLGDFSTAKFQKQTDGELFYKTTFGRDDMPEFTKKLPDDEDRWLIVNYMRTLK
ncbi:cytochrome c [Gaetbulibacter aquiaggeris]|uniref:Cytochrome c n=1 Tax=Gaetbulibacter aquiaggeris TaxID=1735373 RepID=A0ABW7MM86_9FLAO